MRPRIEILILTLFLAFLILSSNASAQWFQQNFPTNEWLMRVRFANETAGWILGFDHVYRTTDGGSNWVAQDSSWGFGEALYVLNDQTVIYSNFTGVWSNWGRGIRRTTNGGLSWATVDTLPFFYTDFEFLDDHIGFGVGMDKNDVSAIRKTTDGGATWNTVSANFPRTAYELQGITFADNQKGWIVSYDGYIYQTINGGMNWILQDSLQAAGNWLSTRDIFFISPDSGWAVGGIGGQLFTARTTDGGDNWILDMKFGSQPQEVIFTDRNIGWFIGDIGPTLYVAKSTDGGIAWQDQTLIPPPIAGFLSISMINQNIGYIVGGSGQVYKTTNGGVVAINGGTDKPISAGITLDQNYPNPFNPNTKIRYSLPKSDQVTLRVYNIAGQVVAMLINERQVAGKHEATFDANELPAGVYFYKLTSGSWSQTRKMLILK